MNNRALFNIAVIAIAILIAIWTGVSILLNPTGGIAGLSKLITIICLVVAFINPKAGLFCLSAQAIYSDQLKRLGVYYGAVSMQTIQEILIGPLLTLVALNTGYLVQLLLGRAKLDRFTSALYLIAPALGFYFLVGGGIGSDESMLKRLHNAGTAGLYTTVVPLCYALMRDFKEWIKMLSFQTVLVVPAAAWAIWQYYNGFSSMEWSYALSGLSPVHSAQMLSFDDPRVFGFFGSASALGCIAGYFAFSFWRTIAIREHRWIFLISSVVLAYTIVISQQRGTLLFPFIFLGFAFCFRRKITTVAMYFTVITTLAIGVIQSTWLLNEGLNKVNSLFPSNGRWSQQVLTVNTFAERLYGWERLTRASTWSLFGTGEDKGRDTYGQSSETYSHDMVNKILIHFGAVGLLVVLLAGGSLILVLHRTIWKYPPGASRNAGAFILGTTFPIVLASAMGGDNFTATPYNLMIWSIFAGVFVLKRSQSIAALPAPGTMPVLKERGMLAPSTAS